MKYDICVLGGCALDQTFYQKVDGTYNEKPDVCAPGGKGANQAVAASRAGAKVVMISRLGNDEIGKQILENLNKHGIDTSYIEIEDGLQNDYANIKISLEDKDNDIERFSGAINSFYKEMIDKYKDVLLNSKIINCQLKVPKEVTEELIEFCNKYNKPLILTPCRPDKLNQNEEKNIELFDKLTIVTCNRKECETIFGTSDVSSVVEKYPNKLIVTLGEKGLIYNNGEKNIEIPAIETDVVDTVGAGDTFNGNLCAFLASGLELDNAIRKAMHASAIKLTKKTAQSGMPYLDELEQFIINKSNTGFEYIEELNFALEIVRKSYDASRFGNTYDVKSKEDNKIETDVDIEVEKFLLGNLGYKYNKDNFVTQESYSNNSLKDRTWVIDPIDGTSHFIKKDGMWGIQLAFYDKKKTRFAIIYLPEKDELYYAAENIGVFLNNNRIIDTPIVPKEQAIVEFGGSLYKHLETKKMCFDNLMIDNKLAVSNIFHANVSCISYTNLVSGKTDALIISSKNLWDITPGEFLCKVLGFKITYLDPEREVKLITKNKAIKDLIIKKQIIVK